MKTKALCAIALLALGCGGPGVGVSKEGTEIQCTDPGAGEDVSAPGYDIDGCSRTERMADVSAALIGERDDMPSDIGSAEQPITVSNGAGAGMPVKVTSNKVTGFLAGGCPTLSTWQTSDPLRGSCLIPNRIGALRFAVDPNGFGNNANRIYLRDRMKEAWGVWSRPYTCGGTTLDSALVRLSDAEEIGGFGVARIPVFAHFSNGAGPTARAIVDKDLLVAKTPVRFGVRYYGWEYAGISIDTQILEKTKLERCLDPADPLTLLKLRHAYVWVFAHELGHHLGLMHQTIGIMRRSIDVTCSELFSGADGIPAMAAATGGNRGIVNTIRDSSGFSALPGLFPSGCSDPQSSISQQLPDDASVSDL